MGMKAGDLMASEFPFYKMYPKDAETDENFRAMSDEELGFYWRCLNHSWLNNGLPSDAARRARVLGKSQHDHDRLWVVVGLCFQIAAEDSIRVINPRQEKERNEAKAKAEKAAESAKRRWTDANVMRTHSERICEVDAAQQCEGNARASGSGSVSVSGKDSPERKTISIRPTPSNVEQRIRALADTQPDLQDYEPGISRAVQEIAGSANPDTTLRAMEENLPLWWAAMRDGRAKVKKLRYVIGDGDYLRQPKAPVIQAPSKSARDSVWDRV